jgi:uncharacterized metal-binding protein YceD (DUF177 family)
VTAPEFSRRIALDRIGSEPHAETLRADPAERAALCGRFGWLSLDRLEAEAVLTAGSGRVTAKGRLRATLTQPCVATGEAVAAKIDEIFEIRFVAEKGPDEDSEIELSADDLDVMPVEDGMIDLGEAVAQTLALALDPYPRSAGADAVVATMGAGEAGPFAGLKDLLKRD